MTLSVHFKGLFFMAHLFLTQISFAVRPILEKSSHFPRKLSHSCPGSGARSVSIQPQKEGQEKLHRA